MLSLARFRTYPGIHASGAGGHGLARYRSAVESSLLMAIPPVTGDQRFMKHINRMALLRLLRHEPGLSRADLSHRSGLTRSTVGLLTRELIDEGWIVEASANITGAPGRRPTPLGLDGRRIVLIGAELGPDAICVVSTSIRGEVLETRVAALHSTEAGAVCHQLAEVVTELSTRATRGGATLLGIGVGLPGVVDKRSGLLELAPNIGWRHVEVGPRLGAELAAAGLSGVPVYFHNEADLAAVGELEFGVRPVDDPLVYVSCGVGVGAGIVLGEALFTGATGSAGEVGHTTLVIDGRPCACGRLGCAEAYIGLRSIAAAADALGHEGIDRTLLRDRMAARHAPTRAAFAHAGRYLGVMLQNVWTTFNPMAVVLGGETVSLGGEAFLDAATEVLDRVSERAGMPPPRVRRARHADRAAAVGGAAYALHATLNPHLNTLQTPYEAAARGR
ncbi:MAG: ROK family transcriptional regulator [Piscinibacter sp.]|nr:ROK family transcriptional regulator [Piscinibacter sp.]